MKKDIKIKNSVSDNKATPFSLNTNINFKTIFFTAIITTLITAFIGNPLNEWFSQRKYSLSTTATYSNFRLPPQLTSYIYAQYDIYHEELIASTEPELINLKTASNSSVINLVSRFIRNMDVWKKLSDSNLYETYWQIEVKNTGRTHLVDMKLLTNFSGYYIFYPNSSNSIEGEFDNSISIGSLEPGSSLQIELWTKERPFSYNLSNLRVTHQHGVKYIKAKPYGK